MNGRLMTERYPNSAYTGIQRELRLHPGEKRHKIKRQLLTQHKYSKHSDRVKHRFQKLIDNDGVMQDEYKTKKFAQRLLPKQWGEAGPRITVTSLPDDYVHYEQPRILTVREWARLQTFPDWYQFKGKRTTGECGARAIQEKEFTKEKSLGTRKSAMRCRLSLPGESVNTLSCYFAD